MTTQYPPRKILTVFNESDYDYEVANSGDLTLTTIGSVSNANACTINGQILQLQPASINFGGVMTTGTQSKAGAKTFTSNISTSGVYQISGTQITSTALSDTIAPTTSTSNTIGAFVGSFTMTYTKVGKMVVLQFPDFSFTSTSSATLTWQLPAGIFPSTTQTYIKIMNTGGTNATHAVTIDTSGLITWGKTVSVIPLVTATAYIINGTMYDYITT